MSQRMSFRNAIKSIFGGSKQKITTGTWKEIGGYTSYFSSFGVDAYANEVVRACVRTLAEHSSKANVKVLRAGEQRDIPLQKIIQYRPNMYMNGADFLYKVRTLLEINNMVFVYIQRDDYGKCTGLYPMPRAQHEAVEYEGGLYIKFRFDSGIVQTHSWEDLAVLRKDYNKSDIFGDSNTPILTSLDLLSTASQGMANAIKSTSNLRGILKTTKSILSNEDKTKIGEKFISDYINMENSSGVAVIDANLEYTPITLQPQIANYKHIAELRDNIYRYFGVNEDIIMSRANSDKREAFYESKIEPFLLALSLELTNKVFTDRERGFANEIMFESNRMSYMSMNEKLALQAMVDRGAMTPNEWRQALNLAPLPGGDVPIRRLDTAPTNNTEGDEEDDK
jgi:HK97 family phage portal protein